jgi:hypothetical protein
MNGWRPWFTATGMAELRRVIAKHVDRIGQLRPHSGPLCHYCWDQGFVLEDSPGLGLIPIGCPECNPPRRTSSRV